jgi:hypothetical protein
VGATTRAAYAAAATLQPRWAGAERAKGGHCGAGWAAELGGALCLLGPHHAELQDRVTL